MAGLLDILALTGGLLGTTPQYLDQYMPMQRDVTIHGVPGLEVLGPPQGYTANAAALA